MNVLFHKLVPLHFLKLIYLFHHLFLDNVNEKELLRYIHNVSPIKKGPSKNFFDFAVQTETATVRGVCFSPSKKRHLEDISLSASPVKLRKFVCDRNPDCTDILTNDSLIIEDAGDVGFERKEILPKNLNISMLHSITPQQLVTIKAKIVNIGPPVMVEKVGFTKENAALIDPSSCIKIVVWQDSLKEEIQEGATYLFKNLRIRKNPFDGKIFVNPAKTDSTIEIAEPFAPGKLAAHAIVPKEFISSHATGEINGIEKIELSRCCHKCKKPVEVLGSSAIVTCNSCNLTQKSSKCKKQWYVRILFSADGKDVVLHGYDQMVMKLMELSDLKDPSHNILEAELQEALLLLPPISVIFNRRTRAIESVAKID
eukprot:gene20933-22989_t